MMYCDFIGSIVKRVWYDLIIIIVAYMVGVQIVALRAHVVTRLPAAFLSRPYAIAAAVGSLIMRSTSRPQIAPASFVACRCASLKYAGTVMTAFVTSCPRLASAVSFILAKTMDEISSGENRRRLPLNSTSTAAAPSFPRTTLKGQDF